MWFDSWGDVGRVVAVGAAAYVALVVVLRVSGKRALTKLNAFDLVVTVALGSTLATVLLSADVSWAEGATAVVVLALLQFLLSWTTAHVPGARHVATSDPVVVVRDGVVDHAALRRQRLTVAELHQALRSAGVGGPDQVAAVVLETNGTLSVVPVAQRGDGSAIPPVPDGW